MKNFRILTPLRVFVFLAILTLGAFSSSADAGDRYAAIAYSRSSGRWGTAYGYKSKEAALEAAVENSGARRPATMWAKNAWLALAVGDDTDAYGYGWSQDRKTARRIALQECSDRTSGARVKICISAYGEDD